MIDFVKHEKKIKIGILIVVLLVGFLCVFSFYSRNTIKQTNNSPTNTIPVPYDTEELQAIGTTEIPTEDLDQEETPSNNSSKDNGNYDPTDTNKDGGEDTQEATDNISPSEQAMIDAGYGNVVLLPTGNYGVLMPNPDYLINGKDGGDILIEYLAEKGLQASSVSGSWMDDQYYNWIAKNITELITPDDEEFWD